MSGFSIRNLLLGYDHAINPHPWTLTLPEGKTIALLGPNGSGKTTFLKALMGESALLSGDVYWESEEVRSLGLKRFSRIFSFLPQGQSFPPALQVQEFLRLAFLPSTGLFGDLPSAESAPLQEALARFDLKPFSQRPLSDLSMGERQRVFLARVFLQGTPVVFLDEPTNHLDPGMVHDFWQRHLEPLKGKTVVISTHDLAEVKAKADWVVALKGGRLIANGELQSVWSSGMLKELFPSLLDGRDH